MAKTGRPPKPTALRILHGDKRDRFRKGEPVPDSGEVLPPKALDAEALAIWHELAPEMIRKGVLTPWDTHLFGVYCQALVYAHQAEVMVSRTSVLLRARDGRDQAVKNPAVQVFRDMSELAMRAGGQFGQTPSDRARLATGQDGPLPGEHLLTQ